MGIVINRLPKSITNKLDLYDLKYDNITLPIISSNQEEEIVELFSNTFNITNTFSKILLDDFMKELKEKEKIEFSSSIEDGIKENKNLEFYEYSLNALYFKFTEQDKYLIHKAKQGLLVKYLNSEEDLDVDEQLLFRIPDNKKVNLKYMGLGTNYKDYKLVLHNGELYKVYSDYIGYLDRRYYKKVFKTLAKEWDTHDRSKLFYEKLIPLINENKEGWNKPKIKCDDYTVILVEKEDNGMPVGIDFMIKADKNIIYDELLEGKLFNNYYISNSYRYSEKIEDSFDYVSQKLFEIVLENK